MKSGLILGRELILGRDSWAGSALFQAATRRYPSAPSLALSLLAEPYSSPIQGGDPPVSLGYEACVRV